MSHVHHPALRTDSLYAVVDLADGLALRRLAERCADRGAAAELDDAGAALLARVLDDRDVAAAAWRQLGSDRQQGEAWIERLMQAVAQPPDEDAALVSTLAMLGDSIIAAAVATPETLQDFPV